MFLAIGISVFIFLLFEFFSTISFIQHRNEEGVIWALSGILICGITMLIVGVYTLTQL